MKNVGGAVTQGLYEVDTYNGSAKTQDADLIQPLPKNQPRHLQPLMNSFTMLLYLYIYSCGHSKLQSTNMHDPTLTRNFT